MAKALEASNKGVHMNDFQKITDQVYTIPPTQDLAYVRMILK